MIDPLKIAQQKVKLNKFINTARTANNSTVVGNALQALNNLSIPEKIPTSLEKLDIKRPELPIQPDPELIKKEVMAKAQIARADAEQLLQQKKEEEINKLREKVETLAAPFSPLAGLFLKLPLIDPKFLAYVAYMEAKERVRDLKQKASKENLKKSKESFTFPMKPPTRFDLGQVTNIEIPKIPEIPKINIPTIDLPVIR